MYIPEKAIITAKTKKEAKRLLDFLCKNGYYWGASSYLWHYYGNRTCYTIENNNVMFEKRDWYQQEIERMEAGEHDPYCKYSFIPEDPSLRFISTDDFLALCCGVVEEESTNVDISTLI